MDHLTKLKVWMDRNGYSNSELAQKLGCSYELIYSVMNEVRPITNNFRWRFAQAFGWEEASRIFNSASPSAEVIPDPEPTTEPSPEPVVEPA